MGVICTALDHARDDRFSPAHPYFTEASAPHMAKPKVGKSGGKGTRVKFADKPGGIDYVTVFRLENPTHWYRDPVDETVFQAVVLASYLDDRKVIAYFRGNTAVTVYEVKVQENGLGCCWPCGPDDGVA
jgi:hypothetical protein